jgi:signal transduction histidine kinase/CheY-like chemotaxis protein
MGKARVLVVDEEASLRQMLHRLLELQGGEVREACSAEEALALVADWEPHVALVDLVLPGKNGIQLLTELKQVYPDAEVMVMTGDASADTALLAMRRGAHDYLQKPFENLKDVWSTVQRALEKRNLAVKNRELVREQQERARRLSSSIALPDLAWDEDPTGGLREILDNFLASVVHELDVERASLMMLDQKTKELRIVASRGIPTNAAEARIALGEGIAGQVAATGEIFLVTDARKDGRLNACDPELSNSFISAPIVFSVAIKSSREVFGVINVTNRRSGKPFSSDDVAFLSGLASQLGVIVEGARRSAELHKAYESLRTAQDQLVFSERIKAVGQMAAGVAHDFNNALSVILSRAQFALGRLQHEDADLSGVLADLRTIVKTALQGAETIKRIQDYTRIRKDQPGSPVALDAVIRDAVEIARPKWKEEAEAAGKQIRIDLRLREVPAVSGNVYELTQVLGNLIFNAVEAIGGAGTITIETVSEPETQTVVLRVSDTGAGMDDETRRRLFEPFFTTKESGQGLGTSIVYGIVSRHRGKIEVDSTPGRGTTFTIRLPQCSAGEPERKVAPANDADGPAVSARVLLVDDDEAVRDTNMEILTAGGHEVVGVPNGKLALARLDEGGFDLVITDLSMPGMSGLELTQAVKRRAPGLPVLLFSGWAIQEQEAKVREAGIDAILVKPCLIEDLLAAVRRTARPTREPAVRLG